MLKKERETLKEEYEKLKAEAMPLERPENKETQHSAVEEPMKELKEVEEKAEHCRLLQDNL